MGAWLQQHHQAKTVRMERQEGYSRAAADAALGAFLKVQQVALGIGRPDSADPNSLRVLTETVIEHTHTARHAALLLVRAHEVRERLEEIVQVLLAWETAPVVEGQSRERAMCSWWNSAAGEALEVLAAHMRDEPLPPRHRSYVAMMTSVASRLPDPS